MDLLADRWLSQLEADDFSFLHQWNTKPIAQPTIDTRFNDFSTENFSSYHPSSSSVESCYNKPHVESSFPSVNFISFGESNSSSRTMDVIKSEADMMSCKELSFNHDPTSGTGTGEIYGGLMEYGEAGKNVAARTALQAQDHILAERKRRQKLADRFIALSAIVPGLKKLDKASVLGGAIKYLKELEERINILEGNKNRQHDQDSAISSKRPRLQPSLYDVTSSSDVDIESSPDHSSPEIEVRISGEEVLLRVCCNKSNGIMKEMLREVEKLSLSVTSSNVMPFGNTTLSITIIAQMDGDLGMTGQDFARNIRQTIIKILQ